MQNKTYFVAFLAGGIAMGIIAVANWHPLLEIGIVATIYSLGLIIIKKLDIN